MEVKVYTREPSETDYPSGLAYSVHMASRTGEEEFRPWNKNYGILFAEAIIRPDDTLDTKAVKHPRIFGMEDGSYGIAAVRVQEDGSEDADSRGKVLLWKTVDFITFDSLGLVDMSESGWEKAGDCIPAENKTLESAAEYWSPVFNTDIRVPECVELDSGEELDQVRAEAVYSDGSCHSKRVVWDKTGIDFAPGGSYEVTGSIVDQSFPFPVAVGYGDPVIFPWEGKWYYISTNDNTNDIGLYVREADSVRGLFREGTVEHLILAEDEERQLLQTFWAPEFHVIGGELYILFAVSGQVWGPQCHMMRLRRGKPIIEADSWEDPVRVVRADGSALTQDGITLDMTYLKTARSSYVVWSYRKHIGTPLDSGSMLYIAAIDEREPWKLSGEPVLLGRPLLGWENVAGTINNEGPYCFTKDGTVYLTYSGGSANSYTYVLGLLTAREEDDLLNLSSWTKRGAPALSFYSVQGEYGPGHNSFYVSEEGDLMIAYHAETALDKTIRCDGIRRVHFRRNGLPEFGMSAGEDLDPGRQSVRTRVIIKNNH
ncbi:MAG: family 43 glycosylhydrolase [Lachnospiraceae bacterium]|nr:family 43 glycosylhydrolase [Lachnospiraceae bacterium]